MDRVWRYTRVTTSHHEWPRVTTNVLLDTICHDELFTSVQFDSETWNSITNFGNKVESLDIYTNVAAFDGRRENWSCNRVIIVVSCKSLQDKGYGLGWMLSIPFDILSSLWNKTKKRKNFQLIKKNIFSNTNIAIINPGLANSHISN